MELSTSKIWTYLKSGRQNPICSTKNSVPLLMEMATCFASPRASPVRGLLALFLLGGRKVWEPGRGRLWVQSYPYIQTSPFSRVFARWPEEGVGSLGGAGFGYRVIPFQTSPFSRVFARWPEGAGSVGAGLGYTIQSYPFSRPLLSRMFLLGGRKVWEAWEGRALGTELSVSRPPSPVCHCAKHGKRRSLERGNFME